MTPLGDEARCALAIGGLDPGGGAGILADTRAFGRAGVFGCGVAAVLTVQSTSGLAKARSLDAGWVIAQADRVWNDQRVGAIKTGALGTAKTVSAIAKWYAGRGSRDVRPPLVVDAVLGPTLGAGALLANGAIVALERRLFPELTLLTLNTLEASRLVGAPVTSSRQARDAGHNLVERGAFAVLVKGGHLDGREATDWLVSGGSHWAFTTRRVKRPSIHGTGCTLASLIAGRLAHAGASARDLAALHCAVGWAKKVHFASICDSLDVGGAQHVLSFARVRRPSSRSVS